MRSLQLWYRCGRCEELSPLPALWPLDRDLLEVADEYPDYQPPCGHGIDHEDFGAAVSFAPAT